MTRRPVDPPARSACANLVTEIENLPTGARWAIMDFIEQRWPAEDPTMGTAIWLAFVDLIRAVDEAKEDHT